MACSLYGWNTSEGGTGTLILSAPCRSSQRNVPGQNKNERRTNAVQEDIWLKIKKTHFYMTTIMTE
jgi:hypothetical protein